MKWGICNKHISQESENTVIEEVLTLGDTQCAAWPWVVCLFAHAEFPLTLHRNAY